MARELTVKQKKQPIQPKPQAQKKLAERELFKHWLSLPSTLRDPQEQQQLAEMLKVDPSTLSDWKLETGFMDEVAQLARQRARELTVDVIHALHRSATSYGLPGASADRKLWLQFFENFTEKHQHAVTGVEELIASLNADDGGTEDTSDEG